MLLSFINDFWTGLQQTSLIEAVAVLAGICSVLLSRAENIWVYPVGLLNTITYVYLSIKGHLLGEASVNIFYTLVSLYGWYAWARKKPTDTSRNAKPALKITYFKGQEWLLYIGVTAALYGLLYLILKGAQQSFAPGAIPWADAFASAVAYVGMWLMARKKVENWIWWIVTDLASVPLYYAKGYAFTTVQFAVFTLLAVMGLLEWRRKARINQQHSVPATTGL